MRISDWSSDVCSSDLQDARPHRGRGRGRGRGGRGGRGGQGRGRFQQPKPVELPKVDSLEEFPALVGKPKAPEAAKGLAVMWADAAKGLLDPPCVVCLERTPIERGTYCCEDVSVHRHFLCASSLSGLASTY